MILEIDVQLNYGITRATDLILQIQAPSFADQRVLDQDFRLSDMEHAATVAGEAGLGERRLLRTGQDFTCSYHARILVDRPALKLELLAAVPPHQLPSDTVRYLMPSRYCPSDVMQNFVAAQFGELEAGARIAAMRDWIHDHFSYVPGSSNGTTTAIDSFVQRQGVCRDYAHVLITFARASAIPARFASVYAPDVSPADFHAVAEVFLDGTWHLVDPTGMATADEIVRIGVGMDAAEVPFLASFGPIMLNLQTVSVTRST